MAGVTSAAARVLIVDDKADIRSVVATRLGLDGRFEVVGEATNGAEAIARVGDLQPELMILDLQMPVMSGEEVIPVLRSLAPQLRILVFSAYARAEQQLRACERPDGEVRKGGDLRPLVDTLRRMRLEPPADLVAVDLGVVDVERATAAAHAWDRLNPGLREPAAERGVAAEFLALVGVFLALTAPLRLAAGAPWGVASLGFATRLEAGRAARRALQGLPEREAALLEPLRGRLLTSLPTGGSDAGQRFPEADL
jgi:CheY-like chemotaxis protein